jgi:hypothetical protein
LFAFLDGLLDRDLHYAAATVAEGAQVAAMPAVFANAGDEVVD